MSVLIFGIGLIILYSGVRARLDHQEGRRAELRRLKQTIIVARSWGYDARAEDKEYEKKRTEHKDWRANIKYELVFWTLIAVGAVLSLIGAALWLEEDPKRWDQAREFEWYAVVGAGLLYWLYGKLARLYRAEKEIEWLNQMLVKLGGYNSGWADHVTERLERLGERI